MERPSFSSSPSVGEALHEGARVLQGASASPRLDSEVLLGCILGYSRTQLIVRSSDPVPTECCERFRSALERRIKGEPIAYITGEREFWGLSFKVSPAVLVPRPESELIIEEALLSLGQRKTARFVDLGVGSGCLAISLITELRLRGCNATCVAVDISQDALHVAQENARVHGVEGDIRFVTGNWFGNKEDFEPPYDIVIANPPYIDPREEVPVELSYEPSGALFSEDAGLKDVKVIVEQSAAMLAPGGVLLCEVGAGKRRLLGVLSELSGVSWDIQLLGDSSPADRFTVIKLVRR